MATRSSTCAMFGCSCQQGSKKDKFISFFKNNPTDKKQTKEWTNIILRHRKDDREKLKSRIEAGKAVVCSEHFLASDWMTLSLVDGQG